MMKKPIKNLEKFREQFVLWTLRRASYRWPPRGEALKAARVGRGLYQCAKCNQVFKPKEVQVDHINPVVPIVQEGIPERNDPKYFAHFVFRMLPERSGFQVLCRPCHATKTADENTRRRKNKASVYERITPKEWKDGGKGRSRKVEVGSTALEGCTRPGKGVDLRSKEIRSKRMEKCSECEGAVLSRYVETLACNKCGRVFRHRKRT